MPGLSGFDWHLMIDSAIYSILCIFRVADSLYTYVPLSSRIPVFSSYMNMTVAAILLLPYIVLVFIQLYIIVNLFMDFNFCSIFCIQ